MRARVTHDTILWGCCIVYSTFSESVLLWQGKLDSYKEKVVDGEELNKDQKVGSAYAFPVSLRRWLTLCGHCLLKINYNLSVCDCD